MLTATLMIAQHVASKATRGAFFLTHFAATDLPPFRDRVPDVITNIRLEIAEVLGAALQAVK